MQRGEADMNRVVGRTVLPSARGFGSGYIAPVLAKEKKRDSLRTLVRDLIEQHGEPGPKDIKWAERMLPPRRRG